MKDGQAVRTFSVDSPLPPPFLSIRGSVHITGTNGAGASPIPCRVETPTAATPRFLNEFVLSDGFVTVWPEQLVFHEKPSRVTGPGGAEVGW